MAAAALRATRRPGGSGDLGSRATGVDHRCDDAVLQPLGRAGEPGGLVGGLGERAPPALCLGAEPAPLGHQTSVAPATGTSRTRCRRREWTLSEMTPHAGQPGGDVDSTVTRRPPLGRSTASTTPV